MSIEKWKTNKLRNEIEHITISKETEKFVFIISRGGREKRESKVCEYHRYHDSWRDAHAYLLERAEAKLTFARIALQRAQAERGNVYGMKEPK